MKESIKQKLPLIIGIGLPMILVLWVLIFVYLLPGLFVKPGYNFVYVTSHDKQYVRVVGDKVEVDPCPYPYTQEPNTLEPIRYRGCDQYWTGFNFYLYDVKNNENIPLSLEEAKAYTLDSSDKSPDGYVVSIQRDSGDFGFFPFFWGGGVSQGPQIGKGAFSKQISLRDNGYRYNFKFLGWVAELK